MSNTTTKNVEQLKIYNSPIYRRKIKKMVELTKNVYGIHRKIPRGSLPKLKETATSKQKSDRALQDAFRLNIETLHYFATPIAAHRTVEVAPAAEETTNV